MLCSQFRLAKYFLARRNFPPWRAKWRATPESTDPQLAMASSISPGEL
jgi:hypothetical protein